MRTTIILDPDLMLQVRQLARASGKTITSIISEAVSAHLQQQAAPQKLSFTGAGRSGRSNLSVDTEQLLKQKFRRQGTGRKR